MVTLSHVIELPMVEAGLHGRMSEYRFFGQFSCMLATVLGNFSESAMILCEFRINNEMKFRSGYYSQLHFSFFTELWITWADGSQILDVLFMGKCVSHAN